NEGAARVADACKIRAGVTVGKCRGRRHFEVLAGGAGRNLRPRVDGRATADEKAVFKTEGDRIVQPYFDDFGRRRRSRAGDGIGEAGIRVKERGANGVFAGAERHRADTREGRQVNSDDVARRGGRDEVRVVAFRINEAG